MSDTITLTRDELKELVMDTVRTTLAEAGVKGYPIQSGRIYRRQMVDVIGRRTFENSVKAGELMIYKENPRTANSKVYALTEDWQRFLRKRNQ